MLDTIYPGLRTFLLGDAQIATAVGTRVYPVKLPQGVTYPAIQVQQISDTPVSVLTGQPSATSARFQVDYWTSERQGGSAYLESQTGGALVRARIGAYVGMVEDGRTSPALSIRVSLRFITKRDAYESDANGGYYSYRADYAVFHGLTGA